MQKLDAAIKFYTYLFNFYPSSLQHWCDNFFILTLQNNYSLSQNGWDTLGSPCPLNVGVQDLVTKPR